MSEYKWCHGPSCHKSHTQDRIRGSKGSKVLRTKKVKTTEWNRDNGWQYFCSQGCWNDFFRKYAPQCIAIAPRHTPLETPIDIETETRQDWNGHDYTIKNIKESIDLILIDGNRFYDEYDLPYETSNWKMCVSRL